MLALPATASLQPAIGVHEGRQHMGHSEVEFDALAIDVVVSAKVVGQIARELALQGQFQVGRLLFDFYSRA